MSTTGTVTSRSRYIACGVPITRRSASRSTRVEVDEVGIDGDVRIVGEHRARLELEDALQLVAQARADVVGLGLERHAEDADASSSERS